MWSEESAVVLENQPINNVGPGQDLHWSLVSIADTGAWAWECSVRFSRSVVSDSL